MVAFYFSSFWYAMLPANLMLKKSSPFLSPTTQDFFRQARAEVARLEAEMEMLG